MLRRSLIVWRFQWSCHALTSYYCSGSVDASFGTALPMSCSWCPEIHNQRTVQHFSGAPILSASYHEYLSSRGAAGVSELSELRALGVKLEQIEHLRLESLEDRG